MVVKRLYVHTNVIIETKFVTSELNFTIMVNAKYAFLLECFKMFYETRPYVAQAGLELVVWREMDGVGFDPPATMDRVLEL